ncbi:MAG: restriction endonuclease, partial [Candidatus Heimdallarchaeota archaeon]
MSNFDLTYLLSINRVVIIVNKIVNDQELKALALNWLNNTPFTIKKNCLLEGRSGDDHQIDFLMENAKSKLVIKVADQRRTVGTNLINKMEKLSKDLGYKTLVISNKFSMQAKHLAQRTDIMIMERDELETVLDIF